MFLVQVPPQHQEGHRNCNCSTYLSSLLLHRLVLLAVLLCCCSTLEGIGKTLNPSYNFSEVATPYAQELLQLQEMGQQGFLIEQLQQQATEVSYRWLLPKCCIATLSYPWWFSHVS